jgi:cytochrome c556
MPAANRHRPIPLIAALFFGTLPIAHAAEPEPLDIVKYRQSVMKSRREHIAAATLIVQGKVDLKSQLAAHARSLAEVNKDTASMFPAGSDVGDTRALGAVWSDWSEFEKRSRDSQQKAADFAAAVAAGDAQNYAARLGDLLDSCKSCHRVFRKPVQK